MEDKRKPDVKIRAFVKKTLGRTPVWSLLLKTRFHLNKFPSRTVNLMERLWNRLSVRALPPERVRDLLKSRDFYGKEYFEGGKCPWEESGYGETYGDNPDFHVVARLARDLLKVERALEVGCARGFLVLALLKAGIEAWGIDLSEYAVKTAPPEVRDRLKVLDVLEADFPEGAFDLVLALEVLEHIPLGEIGKVVEVLRSSTSRYLWATIPSYGENPYGLDGWLEGKIIPRRLSHYRNHLIDLARIPDMTYDVRGLPIHGHLIAASYDWWTGLFTSRGFVRRGDLERVANQEVRSAREGIWNCFLLEKVHPAGEDFSLELDTGKFQPSAEGSWKHFGPELPAGIYQAEVTLNLKGDLKSKHRDERVLTLSCTSEDGERFYGMRLPTRREVERGLKGRCLALCWTLTFDGKGRTRFDLSPSRGLEIEPLAFLLTPIKTEPNSPAHPPLT